MTNEEIAEFVENVQVALDIQDPKGKFHSKIMKKALRVINQLRNSRDDLLAACKKDISAMMDMTSELNRMHTGTTIDYQWADRLKTIETASRAITQDAKQAIAKAEKEG